MPGKQHHVCMMPTVHMYTHVLDVTAGQAPVHNTKPGTAEDFSRSSAACRICPLLHTPGAPVRRRVNGVTLWPIAGLDW